MLLQSSGNFFTYQLMLGTTDMILHSTFDPAGNLTASQVHQQQYGKIMVSGGEGLQSKQGLGDQLCMYCRRDE